MENLCPGISTHLWQRGKPVTAHVTATQIRSGGRVKAHTPLALSFPLTPCPPKGGEARRQPPLLGAVVTVPGVAATGNWHSRTAQCGAIYLYRNIFENFFSIKCKLFTFST